MGQGQGGRILRARPGSLAEELGLLPGDRILAINGRQPRDIIDVSFAMAEEEIELLVEHPAGEQEVVAFDKDADEELGAEFEAAVFDGIRRCANRCCFCFVDMVAPGMRPSLSVRDDDYRMSFLYGNFITLSNLGDADYRRIRELHLSPLFVSVHAMNPGLRARMLRCERAAGIGEQLDRLEAAGADYHAQVVLCPGLNDGAELERTIREVAARRPHALSLAVVPVGLTRHRQDSFPLRQFDRAGAAEAIALARPWQERFRRETGRTFLYLGDEFYFLAGQELPPEEEYDGFPQLDNGIGLARSFLSDWAAERPSAGGYREPTHLDVVAGTSVAPLLERLAQEEMARTPNLRVRVLPVANAFFGTTVNVSGLLTGQDILRALQRAGGQRAGILLPASALRSGEDVFLDDMGLRDLQAAFPDARIETAGTGGQYRRALACFHAYRGTGSAERAYMWQSNAGYTAEERAHPGSAHGGAAP